MKVYKNFDEIRGIIKKTTRKYYENLKKNCLVLNNAEILKKLQFLRKLRVNFVTLQDS